MYPSLDELNHEGLLEGSHAAADDWGAVLGHTCINELVSFVNWIDQGIYLKPQGVSGKSLSYIKPFLISEKQWTYVKNKTTKSAKFSEKNAAKVARRKSDKV